MTEAILLGLLTVAFVAFGFGLVWAAGVPITRFWIPTALALSPMLGMLCVGFIAVCGASIGGSVRPEIILPATVLVVIGVAIVGQHVRSDPWQPEVLLRGRPEVALELALGLAFAALSAIVVASFLVTPFVAWDGWAIWGLHAHALFADGNVSGPVFRDATYVSHHPEYPILFPALEALVGQMIGRFDEELIHIVPALFLVSMGLAVWGVLRTLIRPVVALGSGLAVVGAEPMLVNAADNYVDAALAAVIAVGGLLAAVWLQTGSVVALRLGAGVLAAAGLLKAEGLPFALAVVGALVFALVGTTGRWRTLVLAGSAIALPALVWQALVGSKAPETGSYDWGILLDPQRLREEWHRAGASSSRMLAEILTDWPFASVSFLGAVVLGVLACRIRDVVFLVAWTVLSFGVLVVSYLGSTMQIDTHLATSASRVVLSIAVTALVVSPLIALRAWDTLSAEARR